MSTPEERMRETFHEFVRASVDDTPHLSEAERQGIIDAHYRQQEQPVFERRNANTGYIIISVIFGVFIIGGIVAYAISQASNTDSSSSQPLVTVTQQAYLPDTPTPTSPPTTDDGYQQYHQQMLSLIAQQLPGGYIVLGVYDCGMYGNPAGLMADEDLNFVECDFEWQVEGGTSQMAKVGFTINPSNNELQFASFESNNIP